MKNREEFHRWLDETLKKLNIQHQPVEFHRWLDETLKKLNIQHQPVEFHIHADLSLPDYPKFDPTWSEGTQVKWLETYGRIDVEAK